MSCQIVQMQEVLGFMCASNVMRRHKHKSWVGILISFVTSFKGLTRDHTARFVQFRAKKNNYKEKKQDKVLRNLEKVQPFIVVKKSDLCSCHTKQHLRGLHIRCGVPCTHQQVDCFMEGLQKLLLVQFASMILLSINLSIPALNSVSG